MRDVLVDSRVEFLFQPIGVLDFALLQQQILQPLEVPVDEILLIFDLLNALIK
jgi:hypothetical protein